MVHLTSIKYSLSSSPSTYTFTSSDNTSSPKSTEQWIKRLHKHLNLHKSTSITIKSISHLHPIGLQLPTT